MCNAGSGPTAGVHAIINTPDADRRLSFDAGKYLINVMPVQRHAKTPGRNMLCNDRGLVALVGQLTRIAISTKDVIKLADAWSKIVFAEGWRAVVQCSRADSRHSSRVDTRIHASSI